MLARILHDAVTGDARGLWRVTTVLSATVRTLEV